MAKQSLSSQLISGAAYAYGAGTAAAANLRAQNIQPQAQEDSGMKQMMQQAMAAKRYKKAQNDQIVRGYIDGLPADFDVSQIPDKYRGAISQKLLVWKEEAATAARDIIHFEPGETGYQERVDTINRVKNAMTNLKTQFDNYGSEKTDFLEDYSNKNFSAANDPEGIMSRNASLYSDSLELNIDDDGNLLFHGEGVDQFNYNTATQDQPFNKAAEEASSFLTLNKTIYNAGKDISAAEKIMHRNKIGNILDKGGWEVTQSFLADDLFGKPLNTQIQTVNINGQEIPLDQAMELANHNDPAIYVDAREAINGAVEDKLMNHLNNSATQGKGIQTGDKEFDLDDLPFQGEEIHVPARTSGGIDFPEEKYTRYGHLSPKNNRNIELRLIAGKNQEQSRYKIYNLSTGTYEEPGERVDSANLQLWMKRYFEPPK